MLSIMKIYDIFIDLMVLSSNAIRVITFTTQSKWTSKEDVSKIEWIANNQKFALSQNFLP